MKRFIDYIELRTKVTSILAYLFTLFFLVYHQFEIDWLRSGLFFGGMLCFDATTTAINNYIDAKDHPEMLPYSKGVAKAIVFGMFGLSVALGLTLAYFSDLIVLMLGMFCFAVGVLYTYGPVPISRQAYGELVSGILYGYFIPFILVYLNLGDLILRVNIGTWLDLSLNMPYFAVVLLMGLIPATLTANIMLANNSCDLEKDIEVKRFTLVFYLGLHTSKLLMMALFALAYGAVVLGVVLKLLPILSLFVLITVPVTYRKVNALYEVRVKSKTFKGIVESFILVMGVLVLSLAIMSIK